MQKKLLLSALLIAQPVLAVEDGEAKSEQDYPQFVKATADQGTCSSTIIGGRWVLTAEQCTSSSSSNGSIETWDEQEIKRSRFVNHPLHNSDGFDMALWELESVPQINEISLFSLDTVELSDRISIWGYGSEELVSGGFEALDIESGFEQRLDLKNTCDGTTTSGDKGAASLNSSNQIVAVYSENNANSYECDSGSVSGSMSGRIDHTDTQSWILETIDGWHYPTLVNTSSSTVITLQSLHLNGVTAEAYTSGDAEINLESSTCDDGSLDGFDTCTYSITSTGEEGTLHLSDDEFITINKGGSDGEDEDEDEGGIKLFAGAMSTAGMLALFAVVSLRRKRIFKD
ncbi:trypsin-like serine protease [Psychromonas aquimarina]|uniref:trypsin-like serine protease n=1 Tax=Psychromonas aquimarina TaxID=444919 RepID=UPI00041852F8|nr:trypsin-like serine protease [Psychromonas aquimarina]